MGTAVVNHAAAVKRLDALFDDIKIETTKAPKEVCTVECKHDRKCDVHGGKPNRCVSLGNVLQTPTRKESTLNTFKRRESRIPFGNGVGPRRESMPALNSQNNYNNRRRDSLILPHLPPNKNIEHPSNFPSMLRKDPLVASMVTLRKDGNLTGAWNYRRDSLYGSTNSLKRDFLQVPNANRRNSRRLSNDSLEGKRNSWDPSRRGSGGSSGGWDDPILEDDYKVNDEEELLDDDDLDSQAVHWT